MIGTPANITPQAMRSVCLSQHKDTIKMVSEKIKESSMLGRIYTDFDISLPPIVCKHLQELGFDLYNMSMENYKWIRVII